MKLGLALGGGGVRGLTHILALEVLDERGIRPDVIAGTSIGAIIGGLYASGLSGAEIREIVRTHIISSEDSFKDVFRKKGTLVRWLDAVRPTRRRGGLFTADRVLNNLLSDVLVKTFDELEIPLRVVAADFHSGEPFVFESGELLHALTASMSIPGVFVPTEHEDRILVDGGVVNNLPYDLLLDECDTVIAVDVSASRTRANEASPNIIDATLGMFDILTCRVQNLMMAQRPPTIHVHPTLTGIRILDFDKAETVYEQALPAMEDFKAQLGNLLDGPSVREKLE